MAKLGNKIHFSGRVFKTTQKVKLDRKLLQAEQSRPEYRQEIARVFQMANRRIQNIERGGLLSPAVAALNKGDIKGFTKFSMRSSWNDLKIEYGRAISFLQQPTSTAAGTRQYNTHLQKTYDLTPDEFNLMARNLQGKLSSLSDRDFVEKYLMRYKDFTGELEASAADVSTQIEDEAKQVADVLDAEIEKAAMEALDAADEVERIMRGFADFGL